MIKKQKVSQSSAKKSVTKDLKIRCPMHKMLTILNGPWTTYILWLIRSQGPQRFGEFKRHMPKISAKVLTERLRMLEDEKIINRHQENTIPLKVTYSLTKRGKQLDKILDEINKLAKKWYNSKSS
jgi:DNA-binding HxlR family transcriptional regulator